MKKSYLNSERNSAVSLKPSMTIRLLLMVLFVGNIAFGQIVQRGTNTTANVTNNASLTINKPVGVVQGDVLIANLSQVNSATSPTSPIGWTKIVGSSFNGTNGTARYASLFYKVAGASEGTNYTFNVPTGTTVVVIGAIVAFSGVDVSGATPFDVTPGTISVQGSQTGVVATSITTVSNNAAVIMFGESAASARTWTNWATATSPGTLAELYDRQSTTTTTSIGAAWAIKATAGNTGTGSATLSNSERNGGILIALKPAPPTISSLGSLSGCVGSTITINGTNLNGAGTTAANVKIGGTPVTSITSNTGTTIVAVVGSGTTGYVTVTSSGGNVSSTDTFTVNALPITSIITGSAAVCANSTGNVYSVSNTASSTYTWTLPTGASIISGLGTNSITVTFGATSGNVAVTETNSSGCIATQVTSAITVNPLPTITLGVNPSICVNVGTAYIPYTSTSGNPDGYGVDFDGVANAAGFVDFSNWALTAGQLALIIPNGGYNITPGVYNGNLIVYNNTTTCTSVNYPISVTVNPNGAASVSIAASPSGAICVGTSVTFTATPAFGGATPTYQWKLNGGIVGTNSATYTNAALANGNTVVCSMTSSSTCATGSPATSNSISLSVNPAPNIGLTVGGTSTICTGSGTNITVSSSVSGTTYQLRNGTTTIGSSVSGTGGTISLPTGNLSATTTFNILATITASGCSSQLTQTEIITVNQLPNAAGTISGPTAVCQGQTAVAYSVPTIGNITNTSSYIWAYSGNGATFSNTTIRTPTVTFASNATSGNLTVYGVNSCGNGTISASFSVTVNPLPTTPTLTAGGATTFCAGGTVVLTSNSSANGYLWYKGGAIISGATSQSYSATTSGSYTLKLINASGCQSVASSAITVTVSASPSPTIEFTQNQNDKTYTISAANCGDISGGNQNDIDIGSGDPGGSATYQWQVSFDGEATWSEGIGPSATLPQYKLDPAYAFYEKVAGTYSFRVIITNNGCAGISDTIVLTVTAGSSNLSSGTIAASQNYCTNSGNPNKFTQTTAAAGGDGNGYNYQWQSSPDNTNFANISNATNFEYDSGSIIATTYYRRIVSSGSCSAISNTVAVSIQRPAVSVIQTSCSYQGTITVISPAPSGTSITYTITGSNLALPISNTSGIFSPLAPGTYTVTDNVNGCQSFGTTVIINGTPTLATAPSASAVFQPTISVPTGIITVSPITSGYAYSIDGIDYSNTTGIFYSVAPGTYHVTAMNGAGCPPSAATVVIIGALTATPTITASGPTSFCAGGSVTLTSSAGTTYLWSNGATTASITPTTSGSYTVRVTSNGYQSAPSTATVVTVNPLPTAPTISASGPISFCIGGSVTLTSSTGSTYLWSTGETTQSISPATAGSYTVQITTNGCQSTSSTATVVTVNPLPATPTITANGPTTFCSGGSVTLTSSAGTTYLWSTGATTASISPTTAGSYTVQITNVSGCQSAASTAAVITLNPLPATPTITANGPTTLCAGGSVTLTSSAGSTYLWSTNETTASISPTTSGSYSVKVTNVNGCESVSSIATVVTVNSLLATPSVSPTQPTCAEPTTGTITVTAPIAAGMTYSTDGSTYTNTTGVFTLVDIGSYDVTAKNASGCISAIISVTISPLVTNTWSAGAWSLGTPTAEQNIVFDGVYPPLLPAVDPNVDIVGCSCLVNTSADVIIKTGRTLKLTNELVVDGFLTFEDKASLVQINDVTNTGDVDYLRTTDTGIYNTDYIYWSSPVEGITLGDVSQNRTLSDKYYSYVPTATGEDWQQESSLTQMVSGSGYIIRGSEYSPSVLPGSKYTATFTGVPNNGHYEITPIYEDKSYLLGNPYPSALDADTFLEDNAAVLNGTLYFWTHNTDMQARGSILSTAGAGAFAYTTNDYATYNATGGVSAAPADPLGVTGGAPVGPNPRPDSNKNNPSGKIATGQGFFASTKIGATDTKIIFDNTMRVGVNGITGNNSQFFKTKKPDGKTVKAIEKNRVWLNLTNAEGAFKQTLVGYLTNATNEYDDRFDGESFDGNEFVDFYSVNQDKNLTIQGRALPFDENDEVPLGYRTTINGDFTINIDQVDGSLTNQAVFIEDKLTNTVTDLKSGDYTFNTVAGTFNDRFVLKYTSKTLSVDAVDKEDGILVLYSNNYKTLIIHNNVVDSTVNTVALYNITGQKISNWNVKDSEQTTIQIPIKNISSGIYIVKVNTTNGESSKKIIVN
jgi:hypothetical protein